MFATPNRCLFNAPEGRRVVKSETRRERIFSFRRLLCRATLRNARGGDREGLFMKVLPRWSHLDRGSFCPSRAKLYSCGWPQGWHARPSSSLSGRSSSGCVQKLRPKHGGSWSLVCAIARNTLPLAVAHGYAPPLFVAFRQVSRQTVTKRIRIATSQMDEQRGNYAYRKTEIPRDAVKLISRRGQVDASGASSRRSAAAFQPPD